MSPPLSLETTWLPLGPGKGLGLNALLRLKSLTYAMYPELDIFCVVDSVPHLGETQCRNVQDESRCAHFFFIYLRKTVLQLQVDS